MTNASNSGVYEQRQTAEISGIPLLIKWVTDDNSGDPGEQTCRIVLVPRILIHLSLPPSLYISCR